MKTLYESILANTRDKINSVKTDLDKTIITDFIKEHYRDFDSIEIHERLDDDPSLAEWKRGRYQVKIIGDLRLHGSKLTTLTHDLFYFWVVTGNFNCWFNKLKNLHGAPTNVYGNCSISNSPNMTSLAGLPMKIHGKCELQSLPKIRSLTEMSNTELHGGFRLDRMTGVKSLDGVRMYCGKNDAPIEILDCPNITSIDDLYIEQGVLCTDVWLKDVPKLKSLIGLPNKIWNGHRDTGSVKLINLGITNLNGCPSVINDKLTIFCNSIKDLIGCPTEVRGIEAHGEKLKSLKGAPKKVWDGGANFEGNPNLVSLDMDTEYVNGNFCVHNCPKLKSLKNCPKVVDGGFYCDKRFTTQDVYDNCKPMSGHLIFNEY